MDITLASINLKIMQQTADLWRERDIGVLQPVRAWRWMAKNHAVPDQFGWIAPEVVEAWMRCLHQYDLPLTNFLLWDDLRLPRAASVVNLRAQSLCQRLLPLCQQFQFFLREAGIMLILVDAENRLMTAQGETPSSLNNSKLFSQHFDWSEQVLGNNGIGTAGHLLRPVAFQGMEHFLSPLHSLSSIGYPLLDDKGQLLAVLGLVANRQESMSSLFAFMHLLCVLLNSNLPLTRSVDAQQRVLSQIQFKQVESTSLANRAVVSPSLRLMIEKAVRLQLHRIPLLITGESGVGKAHFVELLKVAGPRNLGPLISLNCASIPRDVIEAELFGHSSSDPGLISFNKPGKFQLADQGVLFLDEIGDMSLDLQASLLRVLETSEITPIGGQLPVRVDVQIVTASQQSLQQAVDEGRFRRDLYYRLNGAQIHLLPLRQCEDKQFIIQGILQRELDNLHTGQRVEISPAVVDLFERHPWPGNIRQLINVIRSVLYTADNSVIERADLPQDFVAELKSVERDIERPTRHDSPVIDVAVGSQNMSLEHSEVQCIKASLQVCGGNISQAARQLGITRATLYKKIERFGLKPMLNGEDDASI